MNDLVTRQQFLDALRMMREELRASVLPSSTASLHLRTRILSVSTSESGRDFLTDGLAFYRSGVDGEANTQFWRLELAGHLVIPKTKEPAATFGDPSNGSYFPVASTKYRPKGGKPGDVCMYSLADKPAMLWNREDGSASWVSAGGAKITLDKSTQDVVVNGGTKKVARVGDRARGKLRAIGQNLGTTPPTFSLTLQVVNGTSVTTLAQFQAAGVLTVPPHTPPGPPTVLDIDIDSPLIEGAAHFFG